VAWLAVLAGVVGVALAGGSRSERATEAVVPPSPIATAAPSVTRPRSTVDPARDRALLVRGWVSVDRRDVHVMVTTGRGGRIVASPIDPTGMPRNGMIPFEAAFRIPRGLTNPDGDMYVVPVGSAGNELDGAEWVPVTGSVVELVVR
jgi:hypothetical protein